jgi:hypothetical protein
MAEFRVRLTVTKLSTGEIAESEFKIKADGRVSAMDMGARIKRLLASSQGESYLWPERPAGRKSN